MRGKKKPWGPGASCILCHNLPQQHNHNLLLKMHQSPWFTLSIPKLWEKPPAGHPMPLSCSSCLLLPHHFLVPPSACKVWKVISDGWDASCCSRIFAGYLELFLKHLRWLFECGSFAEAVSTPGHGCAWHCLCTRLTLLIAQVKQCCFSSPHTWKHLHRWFPVSSDCTRSRNGPVAICRSPSFQTWLQFLNLFDNSASDLEQGHFKLLCLSSPSNKMRFVTFPFPKFKFSSPCPAHSCTLWSQRDL